MKVLITGTSRGIGLEFCRQARAAGHEVLAVLRQPEKAPELKALGVETFAADLNDERAPARIAEAAKAWGQVDLLINNAGIYRKDDSADDFMATFKINSIAPFFVTRALLPLLKRSPRPTAVHISSLMGSIKDNSSGDAYSYRASKAALNAINKSLSVDQPWLTTVVLHPGWVQTDMGGGNATTKANDSVAGLLNVVGKLEKSDSGKFFDFRGRELPW